MHVQHNLNPQNTFEPFLYAWTNDVPYPENNFLLTGFLKSIRALTGHNSMRVNTFPLATVKEDGTKEASPIAPCLIQFSPSEQAKKIGVNSLEDYRYNLANAEYPMVLFDVYGYGEVTQNLKETNDKNISVSLTEKILMGQIKTVGPFVSSEFADKKLFFRHNGIPLKSYQSR